MICLDTSFVIDYWNGESHAARFLETADDDFAIPAVAKFELYAGVLLSDAPGTVASVAGDLDWTDTLPFTDDAASRAAAIDARLVEAGEPINAMDVLIAGTALAAGAPLVTTDGHFERVQDLDVIDPKTG